MDDLISRQAAIELIRTLYPSEPIMRVNRKRWNEKYKPYIECEKALERLPSAQLIIVEHALTEEEIKNIQQKMTETPIVLFPSAQPPAPQWIPCSERLPEKDQMVITTICGADLIYTREGETLEEAIERARKMKRVSVGFLKEEGWYGATGYPEIVTPSAWMPLPEAYEVEDD